ncbi:Acetylene hydratase [bioreactor metagenome]|uniref:Acetylene hydratase n=1 Tax=bioreactor metagenome TaxID=1076179 RepID=A0A644VAN1_9ZZZZ
MEEEVKKVICGACDFCCGVQADVEDNRVIKVGPNPDHPITPNTVCRLSARGVDVRNHPDRLLYPLKRVGDRGAGKWERVTWDQALDDISNRLKKIIEEYGPEALASSVGWAGIQPNEMSRRFMNLLGSPNWTWPGFLCLSNTSVISKITYGWYQFPDYGNTDCVVLWGHDPQPNKWTGEYNWLRNALKRGAKLIVVDPFNSFNAKKADIWLQIRPGTDAALALGWLNVIINEGLYDKEFVEKWTVGFDELKERVQDYSPEKVEEITWVPAEKIREAARMYAAKRAIIPWGSTLDEIPNTTDALRANCILRAITGKLDVPGGELLMGYHPQIVSQTELELNEKLPEEQKKKQLGMDRFKVLSWECFEMTSAAMEKVWDKKYSNQVSGGVITHPPSLWTAMIEGKPYPVKAFIASGNNTLMSFTNTKRIYEALKSLDLLVVVEHFMTPTAQLADYVLPAAHWLERPVLHSHMDWIAINYAGEKAVDPPGECWTDYKFWRELAVRMGQEEYWPWNDLEELYDYRLKPLGCTHKEFVTNHLVHAPEPKFKKYEETGFGTPSGKVELYSSILEKLGYDPLPRYDEPPESPVSTPELHKEYPLVYFVGERSGPFFQSSQRMIKPLREIEPDPLLVINPNTAYDLGIQDGDWVYAETKTGKIKLRAKLSPDAHPKVVRIPHGWWFPEKPQGEPGLSGLWDSCEAAILDDKDEYCDTEQGIPCIRGLLCKVYKAE